MRFGVYTIYDRVAGVAGEPFVAKIGTEDVHAPSKRKFVDSVNYPKTGLRYVPNVRLEDFELRFIGYFENEEPAIYLIDGDAVSRNPLKSKVVMRAIDVSPYADDKSEED